MPWPLLFNTYMPHVPLQLTVSLLTEL
jgi:hypothetical protein